MTEQELIYKLQSLKQINPRENWVLFTKNQILNNEYTNQPNVRVNYASVFNGIFKMAFSRNVAYSVAVFLFIMTVGIFAIMKGILPNNSSLNLGQNSTASLVAIQGNVEEFKMKSKTLSDLTNYNSENVSLAIKEVEDVAKELTGAMQKDPQLAKQVALDINNNKTYLEITGGEGDLQATLDVLYKTTVEQLIKDFDNATLTESQQKSLDRIKSLLSQTSGNQEQDRYDFTDGLEDLLLLSAAVEEK